MCRHADTCHSTPRKCWHLGVCRRVRICFVIPYSPPLRCRPRVRISAVGRVAEWSKAPVLKRYVQLQVTGVVEAPLEGEGIDLTVTARSSEFGTALRSFWPGVPRITAFTFEGRFTGDARSLRPYAMTARAFSGLKPRGYRRTAPLAMSTGCRMWTNSGRPR